MSQQHSGYVPTLDGWRAIAVLLVIGAHGSRMLHESGTRIGEVAASLFEHAGYGVDIFFAISGFLICTLLLREKNRGGIDLRRFYVRRAFRILPPIAVYMTVIILLNAAGLIALEGREVAAVVFFYRNYMYGNWYTGHFWSLAIEEHFYLVVPLVIAFCTPRRMFKVALGAALVCIVIRYLESLYLPAGVKVEFRSEARFDALMWGAMLAMLAHSRRSCELLRKYLNAPTVVMVLVCAFALLILLPTMPARRTVMAIAIPIVLGYTILRPTEWFGRMLENRGLRYIGTLSYSLYIWQMLFFVPTVDMPLLQNWGMAIVGTVVCSLASYYLVEKPIMARVRRQFPSRILANPLPT